MSEKERNDSDYDPDKDKPSLGREGDAVDPDKEEDLGPAAELFKTAGVEAAAEISDSEQIDSKAHELGVEHEGIEASQILGISLAFVVVLIVIIVLLLQYVDLARLGARADAADGIRYPDLEERRMEAEQRLNQYGVVDEEEGIYRVPIERAIQLMVEEDWQETRTGADD